MIAAREAVETLRSSTEELSQAAMHYARESGRMEGTLRGVRHALDAWTRRRPTPEEVAGLVQEIDEALGQSRAERAA